MDSQLNCTIFNCVFQSLPEILTISGVVPIAKESKDELESCADTADQLVGSEGNGYIWTI